MTANAMPVEQALRNDSTAADIELLRRGRNGDREAFDQFVLSQLRLVTYVLAKMGVAQHREDYWDLFQVGCIGLIKACRLFDFDEGVSFSTYAVPAIDRAVRRYRRGDNTIRVSHYLQDKAYRMIEVGEQLAHETGSAPTCDEIAQEIGTSRQDVVFALGALPEPISLHEPIADGERDPMLLEDVVADPHEDVEERVLTAHFSREMFRRIRPNDRKIVYLHAMGLSHREIGRRTGMSRTNVALILNRVAMYAKQAQ